MISERMNTKKSQKSNDVKDVKEVRAVLRFLRQGPRKVRLVGNVLRGLDIRHARAELSAVSKRATTPLLKLLNSAVANAKHNQTISEDRLFVKQVRVDDGPALKRFMPKAHGRATEIKKRSCHVTFILGIKPSENKEVAKKDVKEKKEIAKSKV